MDFSFLLYFIVKGLEISSPIAFASLGGVFSERGGVVNIALEGIMGVTALTLVWGAIYFQSIWMGLIVAMVTGVLMGLIHAVVTVTFKVDHIVSGVAINVFTIGLSRFLCQTWFGAETQSKINPYLFVKLLDVNSLAFWLIPITALCWFIINKTVFGLRLRSVGENPEAADTLGVNVTVMRYTGVLISGALCGQVDNGNGGGPRIHRACRSDFRQVEPGWRRPRLATFRLRGHLPNTLRIEDPHPEPVRADVPLRVGRGRTRGPCRKVESAGVGRAELREGGGLTQR
jgi:hypothetical protein